MDEVQLPDIEVSADQQSMEIRKLAASRKIVINQNDFENLGDITAGDVIKRYPGLWVQGPVSSNRNVLLCGLDKVFQSILIDGNRPAGGEADREFKLDRIPLDAIDRIEIINIPTVDYCSDAVAGVVNLVTKKNELNKKFVLDIAPSINSTDYKAGNGETYLSLGGKGFFISGSYNRETRLNTEELYDPVSDIAGEVVEDCDIGIFTFNGKAPFSLGENSKLTFDGLYSHFDEIRDIVQDVKLRTQGGLNYRDIITDQTMFRGLLQLGASFVQKFDERRDISSRLLFSRSDDEKVKYITEEKSDGTAFTDENEDQENYEYMFSTDYSDIGMTLIQLPNTLKTGLKFDYLIRDYDRYVETVEQALTDTTVTNEGGSFDYSEMQAGYYLRNEIFIKPVIYSFGIRAEYAYYDYKVIDSVQTGNNDYFFINPSILLNYRIDDNYIAKAGFSRQIARPPFASVVPVDKIKTKKNIIERGNPLLLPADAWVYNLGIEFYKGTEFFSVYGYFKDINNIIEIENVGIDEATGYNIQQFVNIAEALAFGVDVEFSVGLNKIGMKDFSLSGNYSWLGSQIEDRNTGMMRRINEQPLQIINGSLNYRYEKLLVSFGANFSDEKIIWATIVDGEITDKIVTDRYLQFDGSIKYRMNDNMIFYFNAENVFGEEVRTVQGTVEGTEIVGTTYTLGLKYALKDF
jgi:iron complex outermembrane receptor protein